MKALVTGAGGFIGSHLCKELLNRGVEIRALALPGEDINHIEKLPLEVCWGDLTYIPSIKNISDGIDIIFHLAGRVTYWGSKNQFYSAIFDTTKNLLDESAGKAQRFVYISSVCACGTGRHLKGQKEDDPTYKTGIPYNDAKLDAERLVWKYHQDKKVIGTIIRPTNVIGPRSVWVRDALDRFIHSSVPLVDGGRHSASLIYVDNLVDGIILAGILEVGKGRAYHFRDDWEVTWRQYLTDLGAIVDKKPSFSMPYNLAWAVGFLAEKALTPLNIKPPMTRHIVGIMGRNLDIDTNRAIEELGWKTKVSYEEAMILIKKWVTTEYLAGAKVKLDT